MQTKTRKHLLLLTMLNSAIKRTKDPDLIIDRDVVNSYTREKFYKHLDTCFTKAGLCDKTNRIIKVLLEDLEATAKALESKKVRVYIRVDSCPSCNGYHGKYNAKVDINDIVYVVCGRTKKRVPVVNCPTNVTSMKELARLTAGKFAITGGDKTDIEKVKTLIKANT